MPPSRASPALRPAAATFVLPPELAVGATLVAAAEPPIAPAPQDDLQRALHAALDAAMDAAFTSGWVDTSRIDIVNLRGLTRNYVQDAAHA